MGFKIAVFSLIALLIAEAGYQGIRFRRWVWETTVPIRVTADLDRDLKWGRTASAEGLLNQYEKMQLQKPGDPNYLDCGPLRLQVLKWWADWAKRTHPNAKQWHDERSYELTVPLLGVSLGTEIVSVVTAFFLVRFWARSRRNEAEPAGVPFGWFRGVLPGLVAAMVLWFNPATAIDGYGWPGDELWMVPFLLLAFLMASLDWWFTAGLILGVGVMVKGQLIWAIPVLGIWALLGTPFSTWAPRPVGRTGWLGGVDIAVWICREWLGNPAKLIGGALVAIATVASPWVLSSVPADQLATLRSHVTGVTPGVVSRQWSIGVIVWVTGIVVLLVGLPRFVRRSGKIRTGRPGWVGSVVEHRWFCTGVVVVTAFSWGIWPWLRPVHRPGFGLGVTCAIGLVIFGLVAPAGRAMIKPVLIAMAVALLLCMSAFNASSAWWDCGVRFGTERVARLTNGPAENLPALLQSNFGWEDNKPNFKAMSFAAKEVLWVWPRQSRVVSIGELLRFVTRAGLLLTAIGTGLQARRKDARVLIALVAPWVWIYCFALAVPERYLVLGAGLSCICAGISTGMTLIGALLSVVAALTMIYQMMIRADYSKSAAFERRLGTQFPNLFPADGPRLRSLVEHGHPEIGWAVILVGLTFLYFSLAFRGRVWRRGIFTRRTSVASQPGSGIIGSEVTSI